MLLRHADTLPAPNDASQPRFLAQRAGWQAYDRLGRAAELAVLERPRGEDLVQTTPRSLDPLEMRVAEAVAVIDADTCEPVAALDQQFNPLTSGGRPWRASVRHRYKPARSRLRSGSRS